MIGIIRTLAGTVPFFRPLFSLFSDLISVNNDTAPFALSDSIGCITRENRDCIV
jgi:hypothetical protein